MPRRWRWEHIVLTPALTFCSLPSAFAFGFGAIASKRPVAPKSDVGGSEDGQERK